MKTSLAENQIVLASVLKELPASEQLTLLTPMIVAALKQNFFGQLELGLAEFLRLAKFVNEKNEDISLEYLISEALEALQEQTMEGKN